MLMANVWPFVILAVFLADAAPSGEVSDRVQRAAAHPLPGPPPECYLKYFLDKTPPQGLLVPPSGRFICQTVPDYGPKVDFFATLFDDDAGIAIFSAYVVTDGQAQKIGSNKRPLVSWRTNSDLPRQGTDKLYSGHGTGPEGIDKGHLNPSFINSFDIGHMVATFTYSNAVPQYGRSYNRASWKNYEARIAEYVKGFCAAKGGTMYLLTGTSVFHLKVGVDPPTQEAVAMVEYFPGAMDQNRIVRPNSLWTAGCCVWMDKTGKREAESIAVMGNNDSDKGKVGTTSMNLVDLERLLVDQSSAAAGPANLFPSVPECRLKSRRLEN